MPEFILDHGSPEAAKQFRTLDSFTQGYIEAMFFTSTGHGEDEELEHATIAELAPQTLQRIVDDCLSFQQKEWLALVASDGVQGKYEREPYDSEKAGRDFWYSRNGHGTGFWDRGLGVIGDSLDSAAKSYGETDIYRGDDGLLYVA